MLFILSAAIDALHDPNRNAPLSKDLQQMCMLRLAAIDLHTLEPTYMLEGAHKYFTCDSWYELDDCCNWNGVKCSTNGNRREVIELDINQDTLSQDAIYINIEWMPPTTKAIVLRGVETSLLKSLRVLPRDAEYIFFGKCDMTGPLKKTLNLELGDLPSRIVEFAMCNCFGDFHFRMDNLPHTLRIVHIRNFSPSPAYVNFRALPASLEALCYANWSVNPKPEIHPIGGKAKDKRVINSYTDAHAKFIDEHAKLSDYIG